MISYDYAIRPMRPAPNFAYIPAKFIAVRNTTNIETKPRQEVSQDYSKQLGFPDQSGKLTVKQTILQCRAQTKRPRSLGHPTSSKSLLSSIINAK